MPLIQLCHFCPKCLLWQQCKSKIRKRTFPSTERHHFRHHSALRAPAAMHSASAHRKCCGAMAMDQQEPEEAEERWEMFWVLEKVKEKSKRRSQWLEGEAETVMCWGSQERIRGLGNNIQATQLFHFSFSRSWWGLTNKDVGIYRSTESRETDKITI